MIVASPYRIKHLEHQFNIYVDHKPLISDETYKYLGVEIDQSLTWERSCRQNCSESFWRNWSSEMCKASHTLSYTGHLIRYDKKTEIVRYFQGRLCDKIGLLCDKLCDFFRVNLHCFTRFKGENQFNVNRQFECKGIIKHLF